MGRADYDVVVSQKSLPVKAKLYDLSPCLAEGAKVEPVDGDRDVFGDGSVTGPIILSGDLWSIRDQISSNGLGVGTMNRAEALASMDRVRQIAMNLKAQIIVQHNPFEISKLPSFPSSAR